MEDAFREVIGSGLSPDLGNRRSEGVCSRPGSGPEHELSERRHPNSIGQRLVEMYSPRMESDRIIVDPEIRQGKPIIRGTRLTVGDVLDAFARGLGESDVLAEHPQLVHEDILACFAFAAARERGTRADPAA